MRRILQLSIVGILPSVVGCFAPSFPQGIPCSTEGECPGSQICARDNRCYDSEPDLDNPDAGLDAADLADAAGRAPHSFIYIDEMIVNVDVNTGVLLIANTGEESFSTATLTLVGVTDDNPDHTVLVTLHPQTASTPTHPNTVAGGVENADEMNEALNDSGLLDGLIRVKTTYRFMDLSFPTFQAAQVRFDMNVAVTIELDGIQTTLPFLIHHEPGPTTWFAGEPKARRVPAGFAGD